MEWISTASGRANALRRFNEVCSSHDDYVWTITDSYDGTDASFGREPGKGADSKAPGAK